MIKEVFINLKNISVHIPVFDAPARSIRNSLINNSFGKNKNLKNKIVIVEALKNISISLVKGDRLGVTGKNGSGKTTLLRVFCGAMIPTSGKVEISGLVTPLIDISLGLEEDATGYENIILKGLYLKRSPTFSKTLFNRIEKIANLGDVLDLPIRTYSSGMKMRLAYAIATAEQSQILILDEWLSVGDAEWMEKMSKGIDAFINASDIFIFASHDENLVRKLCNKIVNIENGVLRKVI